MMDWIHCNVCYVKPSSERPFFLTSCGHMYCSDCLGNGTKNGECRVCESRCTCIELVKDMDLEVKEFFAEPEAILAKFSQVLEFQKKHRTRMTDHLLSLNQKYEDAKAEVCYLQKITEKLYHGYKEVNKQNKFLRASLAGSSSNPSVQMTPFVNTPGGCFSGAKNTLHTSKTTQGFNSKFVTPHRVNKQRTANGSTYSLMNGYGSVMGTAMTKTNANTHVFLTPPSDTPPGMFKMS